MPPLVRRYHWRPVCGVQTKSGAEKGRNFCGKRPYMDFLRVLSTEIEPMGHLSALFPTKACTYFSFHIMKCVFKQFCNQSPFWACKVILQRKFCQGGPLINMFQKVFHINLHFHIRKCVFNPFYQKGVFGACRVFFQWKKTVYCLFTLF